MFVARKHILHLCPFPCFSLQGRGAGQEMLRGACLCMSWKRPQDWGGKQHQDAERDQANQKEKYDRDFFILDLIFPAIFFFLTFSFVSESTLAPDVTPAKKLKTSSSADEEDKEIFTLHVSLDSFMCDSRFLFTPSVLRICFLWFHL